MWNFFRSSEFQHYSGLFIGAVWCFHGLHSKIFNGIPRHRKIVAKILGEAVAGKVILLIGSLEFFLGVWVLSDWQRIPCATVQTLAIIAMNTLEILLAREFLVSAPGMLFLNLLLLALAWNWALPVSLP